MYVGPENKGFGFLLSLYKNKTKSTEAVPFGADGMQGTTLVADECVGLGKYVYEIEYQKYTILFMFEYVFKTILILDYSNHQFMDLRTLPTIRLLQFVFAIPHIQMISYLKQSGYPVPSIHRMF